MSVVLNLVPCHLKFIHSNVALCGSVRSICLFLVWVYIYFDLCVYYNGTAHACKPKVVYVSDIHEPTLQNAAFNVQLNAGNLKCTMEYALSFSLHAFGVLVFC